MLHLNHTHTHIHNIVCVFYVYEYPTTDGLSVEKCYFFTGTVIAILLQSRGAICSTHGTCRFDVKFPTNVFIVLFYFSNYREGGNVHFKHFCYPPKTYTHGNLYKGQ